MTATQGGEPDLKKLGILLFAGTTEGRELAEFLERQKVVCHVCVATEYGEQVLDEEHMHHMIHTGRLAWEQMAGLISQYNISIAIDATHPYAREVSRNIYEACAVTGCRYIRLTRESTAGQESEESIYVDSIDEAVRLLEASEGNIFVTTGSRELQKYTAIPDYRQRVFVRILSAPESIATASALGFSGKNLICMQGPFSAQLNAALLRETGAKFLVTKESGKEGGFPQKEEAAHEAGVKLIVVRRPEEAVSCAETNHAFTDTFSKKGGASAGLSPLEEELNSMPLRKVQAFLAEVLELKVKRMVTLAGIGPGDPDLMTEEVRREIHSADLLAGAERMLLSAASIEISRPMLKEYRAEAVRKFADRHPEFEHICVLLSGDSGFYSAARSLEEAFSGEQYEIRVLPGISSVQYLAAAVGTAWDDAKLVSIHGRAENVVAAVRTNRKVFSLTGEEQSFRELCEDLIRYGLGDVTIYAGAGMSYSDEKILTGCPADFADVPSLQLVTVLIVNEHPEKAVTPGIPDEGFLRLVSPQNGMTAVPMTKEEIRIISLSKLRPENGSIIWDIGAGTGSVSVECARLSADGQIFAIERRKEACALIEANKRKFAASNITVINGEAPEFLLPLPAPTHAFIGGTGGKLREILQVLLSKNPQVRIVLNAIALETVSEALECLKDFELTDIDITQISVARSKTAGSYHMMTGSNPVYVIAAGGRRDRL